jgi:hypothetical protein
VWRYGAHNPGCRHPLKSATGTLRIGVRVGVGISDTVGVGVGVDVYVGLVVGSSGGVVVTVACGVAVDPGVAVVESTLLRSVSVWTH